MAATWVRGENELRKPSDSNKLSGILFRESHQIMFSSCPRPADLPPSRHAFTTAWLLAAILSLLSCEYNADLQVHIPAWETGLSPVGVLSIAPHPSGSPDGPPYDAAHCSARPDRVVISFYVANDRDEAVGEGERLAVEGRVLRLSGEALEDPTEEDQGVAVDLITVDGARPEPLSLSATVESVRWVGAPRRAPPRLLLLHDHGATTGSWDAADERIAALSEITDAALCRDGPTDTCSVDRRARLSLYRLADDATAPLIEGSRDDDALQTALTELRQAGEHGRAPILFQADGVSAGGLPSALSECGPGGDDCWPVAVLITAETVEGASSLSPTDLPGGARLFAAGPDDSPGLRLLTCETGGFYQPVERVTELRQRFNRSITSIPEYDYGFARAVLLALRGHWEATVTLAGLPTDLSSSVPLSLSATLTITLGAQRVSTEFRATLGGY